MDQLTHGEASELLATAWYVVQVKRFEEQRVIRFLRAKAIPTFLPLMESHRRRRGIRPSSELEPLFPGYLFVQMQAVDADPANWHVLRWTPGVRRILGAEGYPAPMPLEAIDAIRSRVKELGFVRPGVRFPVGARVRIRSGPLAGLEGVFDGPMPRDGRVRVLLELLGEVARTEVDELALESA